MKKHMLLSAALILLAGLFQATVAEAGTVTRYPLTHGYVHALWVEDTSTPPFYDGRWEKTAYDDVNGQWGRSHPNNVFDESWDSRAVFSWIITGLIPADAQVTKVELYYDHSTSSGGGIDAPTTWRTGFFMKYVYWPYVVTPKWDEPETASAALVYTWYTGPDDRWIDLGQIPVSALNATNAGGQYLNRDAVSLVMKDLSDARYSGEWQAVMGPHTCLKITWESAGRGGSHSDGDDVAENSSTFSELKSLY